MDKADYIAIRDELSFEKPLWITLAVIGFDAALVACAFWLIGLGTTGAWILSQIVLTVFYFHNFAILHEAGHGNVSKHRRINTLIGHYASPFCFMPFYPWKMIHQEHHVWAGNIDMDPTLKNLKKLRERGSAPAAARFAWRSWIPASALFQHFVFWFYPLVLRGEGKLTSRLLLQCLISLGWIALVYIALFNLFPASVNLENIWLSLVLYLMLTELVNLPHHVMMPTFHTSETRNKLRLWEQHITTRSCYYPVCISEFVTLNFNFHTEHHYFPHLPWYRLRKLRSLIKPKLANDYNEIVGIGWNIRHRGKSINDVIVPERTHPNI